MKQEDKDLLLKDLSARSSYDVFWHTTLLQSKEI